VNRLVKKIGQLRRPSMSPWLANRLPNWIKKLRRPRVSVWLVSQLAREDGNQIDNLLTPGESLRDGEFPVPPAQGEDR
jgi:hypothetical protein